MTRPVFTNIACAACGKVVGKRPGVEIVTGVLCSDPICNFQPEIPAYGERDARIVTAVMERVPVARVAASNNMSRQRVYQILDSWKAGV